MIDPSNKDLVRMEEHPFITFNRVTRVLTCEHCRSTETGVQDAEHIIGFAQAHRPCLSNATPEQQKAAQQRAHALGFKSVFGG